MVFTHMISATLAVFGLTGVYASPVETSAYSEDAPRVQTTVPERTLDERRRFEDGELAYTWDLTDDQKQMFVDRHNYWRNKAALGELNSGKKAKQMPQMFWDDELAEHAKKFSEKCIWEHSMTIGWREIDYGYGENLYATSGSQEYHPRYIQNSMDNWAYEHEYYNHDTLHCSNPPCGHYTAMVWEHTTRIGCAVAKCNSISGISWGNGGHYVICQYYRGGNWGGQAPYQYSLTTGDGCSDGTYGGSTGLNSQWPGLCNNQNDICTDTNRCSAMQTCASQSPLNGVDTEYVCSAPACQYNEFPGYQVDNAYSGWGNGMSDDGSWAYFQNRQSCEDWCYLNKDASPGCVGCTQQSNQSPFLWFAVKTVDESVRSTATGLTLLVLDCSTPGVNPTQPPISPPTEDPTSEPTSEPTAEPTSEPTAEPTSEPTAEPTAEPTLEPTFEPTAVTPSDEPTSEPSAEPTSEPTAEPTAEPTSEPTSEPTQEPTAEPVNPTEQPTSEPTEEPTAEPTAEPYECTTVTLSNIEMDDACAADKVIVVDGGWKLCRDTPDDCVEWCKANRYTYGCVGVSSDERNPGFYFPVRSVAVDERENVLGGILITVDCAPTGQLTPAPTESPGSNPTNPPVAPTEQPTEEPSYPTPEPTVEPRDYECTTVTHNDIEMDDACAPDKVIVVDGGWKMCRETPDECVEWCKANRYTYGCVGVSSWDQSPGFYFPVKEISAAERDNVPGGILITVECTLTENPSDPPANPTDAPTEEPTLEPTSEATVEPTSEPTSEPTAEPTSEPNVEPTSEPTAEPVAPAPTQPPSDPEQFICTTVTIPDVEIKIPYPDWNGVSDEEGSWKWCRDTPDECVDWCKENRYTGPCYGVTSDDLNPNFYFPVRTIEERARESREGGFLIILDCGEGTLPPTPGPTNAPTDSPAGEGEAKFDIGSCDHLELTDNGDCVATKVYGNNHDCEITVLGDFDLAVREWDVEANSSCRYDYLKLPNGDKFCTNSPQGQTVNNGQMMEWHTDQSVTKDGWKICASSRRRQGAAPPLLRRLQ